MFSEEQEEGKRYLRKVKREDKAGEGDKKDATDEREEGWGTANQILG